MRKFCGKSIGMLVFAALLIWIGMPTKAVIAETFKDGDYEYTINEDDTATITGYIGSETEINIPNKLGVLAVTNIGNGAFKEMNLTKVEIPYGVTFIGLSAFAYNMLEEIEIPGSVTEIDASAFRSNELTKVQLSNGLKIIYSSVFSENRLTEINIPDSVEVIASNAFSKNELTEVHIPKNVRQIELAFSYNPLAQITVDIGNAKYKDIDQKGLYTKDGKTLVQGTISGDIDFGTEEIGNSAFKGVGLTEADIPNGVKRIGPQAFQDNDIELLSLPDSLETIYMFAFAGNKLDNIVVPENVGEIAREAFSGNNLTEAVIWGDPELGDDVFNENPSEFVLWGYTGTSVKTYAEANHYTFEPLNTFADGLGIKADPYIIKTPEQLDAVRHDLQAHYKLGATIDLSDYQSGEGWVPIAEKYDPFNKSHSFTGSFDGNGHVITGLTIKRDSDHQGLFAAVGETGVIRNVLLDNVTINGRDIVGGLAGINFGIIENSSANEGSISGGNRIGGLVGNNHGVAITSSSATAVNVTGDTFIGGLIGENSGSHGVTKTIRYSYASGEVTGNVHVGGLIGNNETANAGSTNEIIDSYATGKVTGQKQAGGLVGSNFSLPGGTIRIGDSYATGNVSSGEQAGGLIGYNLSSGGSSPGTIEVIHSYAIGEVTGVTNVGGLVGENAASTGAIIDIINSYWDMSVYTGEPPDNKIGTPKTVTELMERDTFADWDFSTAWYQYDGQTRPFLQWQNPITSWDVSIAVDTLQIDDTTEITVSMTHKNNEIYSGTNIANYTADPEIVDIDKGTVTAIKGGIATITVSLFGESQAFELTVDGGKPTEPTIVLDSEGWTNAAEVNVTIDHESKDEWLNEVQTIRVKVGDAGWQDYTYGDVPIALKVTTEGTTIIQAQAIDELGNESDIAWKTVNINRSGLMLEPSLVFTDDDQTEYDSGGWTNRSVTAEAYAWHAQGVTVTSVVYSLDEGEAWVNYKEPLVFSEEGIHSLWYQASDEAGNELINRLQIRIDKTAPEIRFSPDGSEVASHNVSSQVTVIDDSSGVDGVSLQYVWATSSDPLDELADWQGFHNGQTLNQHGTDGDWYLHIRARDQAGNESDAVSKRFRIQADNGGTYIGSNNARLSELNVSEGRLTPEFSEDVTEYKVNVAHEAESISLTARTVHRLASIKINDKAFTNDQERVHIPLIEGLNIIEILVTAEDGTRKTYTLTVKREEAAPQRSFTDIAGHWAEQFIMEAASKGFIQGYPNGTFKPDDPVTRAEFTVMLANALKWEGVGTVSAFTDSDQIELWARQAIAQAVRADIIRGYEDGSFRPDSSIIRAEMAVMIARALESEVDADIVTGFADDVDIPQWAKGAVEAIRKLGIVSGRGGNKFVPNDSATRAEATVILLRILEQG